MIRLGGLWRNEKDGRTYLSGKLGNVQVFIFPVREKRGENSPDYDLCIAEVKPREEQRQSFGSGDPDDEPAPF